MALSQLRYFSHNYSVYIHLNTSILGWLLEKGSNGEGEGNMVFLAPVARISEADELTTPRPWLWRYHGWGLNPNLTEPLTPGASWITPRRHCTFDTLEAALKSNSIYCLFPKFTDRGKRFPTACSYTINQYPPPPQMNDQQCHSLSYKVNIANGRIMFKVLLLFGNVGWWVACAVIGGWGGLLSTPRIVLTVGVCCFILCFTLFRDASLLNGR